ncbi:MAG TPA: N-acetylmuramoyl-L-alanine amidase [Chlorobaculum parvum]|uniref:N-acetylmuramoyl-L-alanine amidase n=1 Tax=Chlorobaculum parvum TaxID=274539 RepID=A0A7C5HIM6_9CHLB|nr:N-acetylmuramoyl-L-alanine amidase [Chlorobaculum parvum]
MDVSNAPGQSYTIKVQGYSSEGEFMADVVSFARALRLGSVFDGSKMQIDEAFGKSVTSSILCMGSEFVVVDSAAGNTPKRVIQLAAAPSVRDGRMYLPVTQACRMFSLWLGRSVRYDSGSNRIEAALAGRSMSGKLSVGVLPSGATERPGSALPAASSSSSSPTGKTTVNDIRVETLANGVVIRFSASGRKRPASFLRPDKQGTAYLTIENVDGQSKSLARTFADGIVKSVNPVSLGNGAMQFNIVLDTAAFAIKSSSFRYDAAKNDYVVSIMSDVDVDAIRRAEKERLIQARLSDDIDKWKLDAVVIDAGHGGKDPGAIGTRGTREKDVVLNVALDLGRFIKQKWPGVKVIYTRKDDRFIPLKERGKIANRYGGKLFISIHCNAIAGKRKYKIRGPEVYILGPHKTDSALKVAMLENSVITEEENYKESYKGFSDEYLIMSSMAQSAFAMQSTELAQAVLGRFDRKGSTISNGVRQAGFMVLWTPSMPSILVEAGYLSNPDEEKILRDRKSQTKIAWSIFQGLEQYRSSYERRMMASGYAK